MVWRVIFYPLRERIRSFIRSKTNPLTIDEAEERTAYYSKLYLMVASITLAVSAYYFNESIKSSNPDYKNLSPVEYYLKNMGKEKKVVVMTFSGLSKTNEYVVDNRGNEAVKESNKGII